MTEKIDETQEETNYKVEELSAYLYGIWFLVSLAAFMLLIHIGLDVFFHN